MVFVLLWVLMYVIGHVNSVEVINTAARIVTKDVYKYEYSKYDGYHTTHLKATFSVDEFDRLFYMVFFTLTRSDFKGVVSTDILEEMLKNGYIKRKIEALRNEFRSCVTKNVDNVGFSSTAIAFLRVIGNPPKNLPKHFHVVYHTFFAYVFLGLKVEIKNAEDAISQSKMASGNKKFKAAAKPELNNTNNRDQSEIIVDENTNMVAHLQIIPKQFSGPIPQLKFTAMTYLAMTQSDTKIIKQKMLYFTQADIENCIITDAQNADSIQPRHELTLANNMWADGFQEVSFVKLQKMTHRHLEYFLKTIKLSVDEYEDNKSMDNTATPREIAQKLELIIQIAKDVQRETSLSAANFISKLENSLPRNLENDVPPNYELGNAVPPNYTD